MAAEVCENKLGTEDADNVPGTTCQQSSPRCGRSEDRTARRFGILSNTAKSSQVDAASRLMLRASRSWHGAFIK